MVSLSFSFAIAMRARCAARECYSVSADLVVFSRQDGRCRARARRVRYVSATLPRFDIRHGGVIRYYADDLRAPPLLMSRLMFVLLTSRYMPRWRNAISLPTLPFRLSRRRFKAVTLPLLCLIDAAAPAVDMLVYVAIFTV